MKAANLTSPAITPQSPKEPRESYIELAVTRAELDDYFLIGYNGKRRMSRRMATHLRKMVMQPQHRDLAEKILPPGWFAIVHEAQGYVRHGATPGALYTTEQHDELALTRHQHVMRTVAGEQAKARATGGERRA